MNDVPACSECGVHTDSAIVFRALKDGAEVEITLCVACCKKLQDEMDAHE